MIAALVLATALRPIVLLKVEVQILAILLGGSILVLVGFIDDQFGLPPLFRLAVQILTALLLVASRIRLEAAFGTPFDPLLSVLITVVWIVGLTNAMNLLDGLDGLAGGVSYITAMSLMAVSAQFSDRAAATLVLAALAGAALGFLRHNFHPSRIIMGDAGAYFFGYVLAATSILGSLKLTTALSIVPPLLFLLLPFLDTAQVFIRRLLRGQNPLATPGRDHVHHWLLARGYSQRSVALILWGVTLVFNLLGMLWQGIRPMAILLSVLTTLALLAFTVWRRLRPERVPYSSKS